MARTGHSLPPAAGICALADRKSRLPVRVTPGARSEALEIAEDRLLARVRARPEDGKANAAVLALVASAIGLTPSRLELLRGATAREKPLRIEGWPDHACRKIVEPTRSRCREFGRSAQRLASGLRA